MGKDKWIITLIVGIAVGFVASYLFRTASQVSAYQNEEVITWTDWRGRERRIEIHRKVEGV
jgi:uncharacterized membrane-anchored protein YhcB (DUF1043 family)